jgi:hypothetical protein
MRMNLSKTGGIDGGGHDAVNRREGRGVAHKRAVAGERGGVRRRYP